MSRAACSLTPSCGIDIGIVIDRSGSIADAGQGGNYKSAAKALVDAFAGTSTRFCLVSFTSDWLFPTSESRQIVHALNAAGASVSFVEIETDRGHDAFLLDEPELFAAISGFLRSAARARGLDPE